MIPGPLPGVTTPLFPSDTITYFQTWQKKHVPDIGDTLNRPWLRAAFLSQLHRLHGDEVLPGYGHRGHHGHLLRHSYGSHWS